MGKVSIDVDDDALSKATELYGTSGPEETIKAALDDAAARRRRLAAFDRLRELVAGSDFDYLLDKRKYRQ